MERADASVAGLVSASTFLLLIAACGGDDAPPPDGGDTGVAVDGGGLAIAPPAPPELPRVVPGAPSWACPDGWSALPDGGCDTPASSAAVCMGATMQAPSEAACRPIGDPCGAGDWATSLPAGVPVVYVRPDGRGGADGSMSAPYASIGEAIAAAPAGAVVALAKGTYEETVIVDRPVTLFGACADQTVIRPPVTSLQTDRCRGTLVYDVGFVITADGAAVRNLHVDAQGVVGLDIRAHGVGIDDVLLTNAGPVGILVGGGSATIADVAVRGAPDSLDYREGIHVECDSEVSVTRTTVEHSNNWSLFAHGVGTTLRADDVGARFTTGNDGDGFGLFAFQGASVELRRSLIADVTKVGVLASESETRIVVEDSLITRVRADVASGTLGYGFVVEGGGPATLRRSSIRDVRESGVTVAGNELAMEDVVIDGVSLGAVDGRDVGAGVSVNAGNVTANRVAIRGATQSGIVIDGASSSATFSDLVVSDTRGSDIVVGAVSQNGGRLVIDRGLIERSATFGAVADGGDLDLTDVTIRGPAIGNRGFNIVGVFVGTDASFVGRRVHIVEQERFGVFVVLGGVARFADLEVERTRPLPPPSAPTDGIGILAHFGSTLSLERASVVGAYTIALQGMGADVSCSDVSLRATASQASDGLYGRGMQLSDGATMTASRLEVLDNRDYGIIALGEGTVATFTDLMLERTVERECANDGRCADGWGVGLGSFDAASVSVTTFSIGYSSLAGLQIVDASLDLTDGVIRNNPIGVNLQSSDYDLSRLMDGVRYEDNGSNLDAQSLPVPAIYDPEVDPSSGR